MSEQGKHKVADTPAPAARHARASLADLLPSRPPTPGWVKFGIGLAVIGAEITESVLHPEVAEGLAIADAAIPLIVGIIVLTTIVRGSQETVNKVFRLLRWIRNQPEPPAPDSPNSQSPAVSAEHLSALAGIGPAKPENRSPSAGSDLIARQTAALHEFAVSPEQGLSRAQASAAFKKHGLDPRSFGSWVQRGYLAREENRRWLTDKGREWAEASCGGAARSGSRHCSPGQQHPTAPLRPVPAVARQVPVLLVAAVIRDPEARLPGTGATP